MGKKSPIKDLVTALSSDNDYYIAWKANLAMHFIDAYERLHKDAGIREIANNAAVNFLFTLQHTGKDAAAVAVDACVREDK